MKPQVEGLWLQIRIGEFELILAGIYRPPSNTPDTLPADKQQFDALELTQTEDCAVLVLGDFNFRSLIWADGVPSGNSTTEENDFVDALNNTTLSQLISATTRFRAGQNPSLLDLCLTNEPALIAPIQLQSAIGCSDHLVVTAELLGEITRLAETPATTAPVNYYKCDFAVLSRSLAADTRLAGIPIERDYSTWIAHLMHQVHQHTPVRRPSRSRLKLIKPWVDRTLVGELKKKNGCGSNTENQIHQRRMPCTADKTTISAR